MKKLSIMFTCLACMALSACTTAPASGTNATTKTATSGNSKTKLSVLYAGSMTKVMEQSIRPNADSALHVDFQGEGKGSDALAQMIRSGISKPDIFISASPSVNNKDLMGPNNHDLVKWYLTLAQDQLVIAYSPKSKFKNQLDEAAQGKVPWYDVLEQKGFQLGRTDPALDPKGTDTLFLFQLASIYYNQPSLESKILGSTENTKQVFPEETLLAGLTSGQMDAIIAYKHEATEWGVPYITLPPQLNLGNSNLASYYKQATYQTKDGNTETGAPIVFTITIPTTTSHKRQAEDFVKYMVTGDGHTQLIHDGFTPISTQIAGNRSSVPSSLQSIIQGTLK
ncbi:extracellular solute-binding protein [Alicyclobacillus dauci]|uniref:Extracellular solute-binding protein n=1 Tax=Alicyclobacillus dauci TaxID=1475485 RepID=A0ABY6Z680_9BACL|nr:extracellular solute-binding protein [Alicyclobacillus dauci]WAH38173.1 extracellular solute-binding protein [Alicyclobacillus dauci]